LKKGAQAAEGFLTFRLTWMSRATKATTCRSLSGRLKGTETACCGTFAGIVEK